MKIIALDDEPLALEGLMSAVRRAEPGAELHGFEYAEDALLFAQQNGCDVAFLDVEVSDLDGVSLARQLKELNRDVNIIFCTGYTCYQGDACEMHASGYLLKPITPEKVRRELDELRRPVPEKKRLRIQAFGNFEVYLDDVPLEFRYSRTRELLAYLVDRCGALCTKGELMAVLFEDDNSHDAYFKNLRKDLLTTLEKAGCQDAVVQQRGSLGIHVQAIDCDYYDWREGRRKNSYHGEYMRQYSWAETTNSLLNRMCQNRFL